jgi:hypothetical protein
MPDLAGPLVAERPVVWRGQTISSACSSAAWYLFHIVEEIEGRSPGARAAADGRELVQSDGHSRRTPGLWQFIPAPASYELAQNWWGDGRRDISPRLPLP